MLKEFIIKIEDQDSEDFGKTFKIKQPPVLEFEKLLVKFGSCFSVNEGINKEKTNELLSEILKYCYFVDEKTEVETQLINTRANEVIYDPLTLINLKTEFIAQNKSFIKVVEFVKQRIQEITTTMKKSEAQQ